MALAPLRPLRSPVAAGRNCDRAGEKQAWRLLQAAARIKQAAGAVDVYAHAKVEVSLRRTADHSCEMEYSIGVVAKGFGDELRTCGVPDGVTDPGIQETIRWRGDVHENQFANRLRMAVSVVDRAAFEQFARDALAKEAASTSNDNLHRDNLWGRGSGSHGRSQPRPALVPARGRYSQPIQPLYPSSSSRRKRYGQFSSPSSGSWRSGTPATWIWPMPGICSRSLTLDLPQRFVRGRGRIERVDWVLQSLGKWRAPRLAGE